MIDFQSFLDFAFDIVCMLPALDAPYNAAISLDQAMYSAFGSIALLALALAMSGAKKVDPQMTLIAVAVTAGSLILGFVSQPDLMKTIFLTSYPPMVICLRFGEFSLVGAKLSKKLSVPLVIAFLVLLIILVVTAYCFLSSLPALQLSNIKLGWAILGAIIAAVTWTRMMGGSDISTGFLECLAWFGVFVSTLLYVIACSPSSIERFLFQWSLPSGFLVGIIAGRFDSNRPVQADPRDFEEPNKPLQ
jgi:hypothetical protein